jgi:predicted anti-sigma-YlaC factor YlaD
MQCREVQSLLPQYADDDLSRRQQEEIGAHLSGCDGCRADLRSLARSLDALSAAASTPAPDLWSRFQSRLAREATASACDRISGLLPAYLDACLPDTERAEVMEHLAGCTACAGEEQALVRSLKAVEATAGAPAPDLWPAFTGRLAATIACSEARNLLPGRLAGEGGPQTIALDAHLETCAACAAQAAAYESALGALGRAGAAPAPDLWPAFAARLEQERARQTTPVRRSALDLIPAWSRLFGQVRRPGLGFAAAAAGVALIAAAAPLLKPGEAVVRDTQPRPTRTVERPIPPPDGGKEDGAAVRMASRSSASGAAAGRIQPRVAEDGSPDGAPTAAARTRRHLQMEAPRRRENARIARREPPKPARETPETAPAGSVALAAAPPSVLPDPIAPAREVAASAEERMVDEMVHAFALFAAADEAVNRPLGTDASLQ